jgi:chromosomal replication initiator protein
VAAISSKPPGYWYIPEKTEGYTWNNFIPAQCNKEVSSFYKEITTKGLGDGLESKLFTVIGASSCGKSHATQAMQEQVHKCHPSSRLVYVTLSRLIKELRTMQRPEHESAMKTRYLDSDLVVVDDFEELQHKNPDWSERVKYLMENRTKERPLILITNVHPDDMRKLPPAIMTRMLDSIRLEMGHPKPRNNEDQKILYAAATRFRSNGTPSKQIPDTIVDYFARNCTKGPRHMKGLLSNYGFQRSRDHTSEDMAIAETVVRKFSKDKLYA